MAQAGEQERTEELPVETVPLSDPEFKDQLATVIPHLRAFGRSLSGSRDLADDLVQETLLKAWAARKRFQAGTNMRAWTFIILRNLFLSQMRNHLRELSFELIIGQRHGFDRRVAGLSHHISTHYVPLAPDTGRNNRKTGQPVPTPQSLWCKSK